MDLVDVPAFDKNKFQIDLDSGTPTGLHSTNVKTGRKNSKLFERILRQKREKRNYKFCKDNALSCVPTIRCDDCKFHSFCWPNQ